MVDHNKSCINHLTGDNHNKQINVKLFKSKLIKAMILIFLFMIIEYIGGYFANSLALISDASHMLTDFLSLVIGFIGVSISQKANDKKKTYGYSRFEVLSSFSNTLFLIFIFGIIFKEAIVRFFYPEQVDSLLMLPVAISGLIINIIVLTLFKDVTHGHCHGDHQHGDHDRTSKKKSNTLLVDSINIHFIGDLLGSILVIIVSLVIYYTGWYIVDPVLSVLLVLFILYGAIKILMASADILLLSAPNDVDIGQLEHILETRIDNIVDVYHVHLWMLNEEENILTMHVKAYNPMEHNQLMQNIDNLLSEKYNIQHYNIHVEYV